ncbi:MAG: hypothetical protein QE277_10445 [Flectobacillus sp.]|nr:hypothetical protein [Flectobacillus sp.]
MALPLFIISFANNPLNPLSSLKKEELGVKKVIDEIKLYGCDIEVVYPTTREEIVDLLKLETNRERLYLFSYSGHADGDRLITEEETTYAHGLANLLAECRNLQCVVLNGCSTEKQVFLIQESFKKTNMTTPAIVATSASVGDEIASEFNIHFFQQLLTYGYSINDAFSLAIALINTKTKQPIIPINRFLDEQPQDLGTWGLYTINDEPIRVLESIQIGSRNQYEPNIRLFKSLIRELSSTNPDVRKRYTNDKGNILSIHPYKPFIYQSFPLPISKRLQRLESSQSSNDKAQGTIFYNKIDRNRLGELTRTALTFLDILVAFSLAELYALLQNTPSALSSDSKKIVFTSITNQKLGRTEVLTTLLHEISLSPKPLFVSELASLITEEDTRLEELLGFFEKLAPTISTMNNTQAASLVELAELRIVGIFQKCMFLTNYHLTSIDNIQLNRKRHETAQYRHEVFFQRWGMGVEPARDSEVFTDYYLDNASIILHKETVLDNGCQYINLSPFLIDEVLFSPKANISNIMALMGYKPHNDEFSFRYLIYSSKENEGKSLVYQENDSFQQEVEFENIAFSEIKNEWEHFLNLLA